MRHGRRNRSSPEPMFRHPADAERQVPPPHGASITMRGRKMLRWTIALALWTAGALLARPAPLQAQAADSHEPVSLERIRAALAAPPPILPVPAPAAGPPTFRVEVRQPMWSVQPDEAETFDPTWGLPSAGELLMDGIGKIHSAAAGYKHRRAERRARKEVQDALAAFCAVRACPGPVARQR